MKITVSTEEKQRKRKQGEGSVNQKDISHIHYVYILFKLVLCWGRTKSINAANFYIFFKVWHQLSCSCSVAFLVTIYYSSVKMHFAVFVTFLHSFVTEIAKANYNCYQTQSHTHSARMSHSNFTCLCLFQTECQFVYYLCAFFNVFFFFPGYIITRR